MLRSLQLDDGAVMVKFVPSYWRRTFQILTPNAVAAVRGTKWVVEAAPGRTSVLVLTGKVKVSRLGAKRGVFLRHGQGTDVKDGSAPLVVKRWAEPRVRALMARFGQ
jgi:ferric-dicitrate binding protein FerR (iron transport regulator)